MTEIEIWAAEGLAKGPEGAVKLQFEHIGEPDVNEVAALKAEMTALYRRHYGEWCRDPKVRTWLIRTTTV